MKRFGTRRENPKPSKEKEGDNAKSTTSKLLKRHGAQAATSMRIEGRHILESGSTLLLPGGRVLESRMLEW